MAHYRVAKRYAKGLMDFLSESGKEETVMQEMKQLKSLIHENRDLKNFFGTPVLDHKKKVSIVKNVFAGFSEESLTFISLIINQGRSEAIESIASEFINLYKIKNGIKNAVITSAKPLDQSQIEAIIAKAKSDLPEGTKVEVENKVNPELLGGFILRLDDKQFDASVSTKLNNLRKEFDSKHYIPKI